MLKARTGKLDTREREPSRNELESLAVQWCSKGGTSLSPNPKRTLGGPSHKNCSLCFT